MNRKIIFTLIILVTTLCFAKDRGGSFRGGAGGFEAMILPLKLDDLNGWLGSIGVDEFRSEMYFSGGSGWGYVGNNIRIGGLFAGGFISTNGKQAEIAKEATLTVGFGGVVIEKAFYPFKKTEIYFGTMVGGGSTELKFIKRSGPVSFKNIMEDGFSANLVTDSTNYHNYQLPITTEFFTVMPSIGLRYNIMPWCALGVTAGYFYQLNEEKGWKLGESKVYDMPEVDLSNLLLRINIFFGG